MTASASEPGTAVPHAHGGRWFASWKLWLVLLIVGLVLMSVALVYPTYRRMLAIAYLNDHFGEIQFSDDSEWLTERFGEFGTALRPVGAISCLGEVNDEVLSRVGLLSEVQNLYLAAETTPPLTADSASALGSLRNLLVLNVGGELVPAGDVDLFIELFAARPPLLFVLIAETPMSAAALREMTQIESLEVVRVSTREDIHGLHAMPNLSDFELHFEGEIDLSGLQGSPMLYSLWLDGPLDDEDLRQIGELTSLAHLTIEHQWGPGITDAGFEHLTRLDRLQFISLPPAAMTPTTVEFLRELPVLEEVMLRGRPPIDDHLMETMRQHWQTRQIWETRGLEE